MVTRNRPLHLDSDEEFLLVALNLEIGATGPINQRGERALAIHGLRYIWQVARMSKKNLAALAGIGKRTVEEVGDNLFAVGLEFNLQIPPHIEVHLNRNRSVRAGIRARRRPPNLRLVGRACRRPSRVIRS